MGAWQAEGPGARTPPTCPPNPASVWEACLDAPSSSYLLHATVDKGALAWPGGPVHHNALSELGLLILAHVVRAVQGVQEPCGWRGARKSLGGAEAHGGGRGWGEAGNPGPGSSSATDLLCAVRHRSCFANWTMSSQGLEDDPWEMGVRSPPPALPANCRS